MLKSYLVILGIIVSSIGLLSLVFSIYEKIENNFLKIEMIKTEEHLTTIQKIQIEQIKQYFNLLKDKLKTISEDKTTIQAMKEFNELYINLQQKSVTKEKLTVIQKDIVNFFNSQFYTKFHSYNPTLKGKTEDMLQLEDKISSLLKYQYIIKNPYPLNLKNHWQIKDSIFPYHHTHNKYHDYFKHMQKIINLYDIFLIHSDGRVIYSVFKEIDFGINIQKAPFIGSGLQKIYEQGLTLDKQNVIMSDFLPYLPSYNTSQAFMAAPIFDHGKRIGILAFQISSKTLSELTTLNYSWNELDLGGTEETYLVGQDHIMRSESRMLIQDKQGYLSLAKTMGDTLFNLIEIDTKNTVVNIQKINNSFLTEAFKQNSGIAYDKNYLAEESMMRYAPLSVLNQDWAIVTSKSFAEIKNETTKQLYDIKKQLHWYIALFIIFLVLFIFSNCFKNK